MNRTLLLAILELVAFQQGLVAREAWRVRPISTPAGLHSSVPRLSQGPAGKLLLSWMEPGPDGLAFRFAQWHAGSWSAARTIAAGPSLMAAASSAPEVLELGGGVLVAEWLTKSEQKEANEIVVAASRDMGKTWSKPVVPYRDVTAGEHMYVSLFAWPQGGAGVI